MLKCLSCGAANPLGRVFCAQCGGRLDLSAVSRDDVDRTVRQVGIGTILLRVLLTIVILAVIAVGLALVPRTARIGAMSDRDGVARIAAPLGTLRGLPRGRIVERTFAEEDVNAYFHFAKVREMRLHAVSVDTAEGGFKVRLVTRIGPIKLGKFAITPRLSYDLTCRTGGSAVRIRGCRMGLLPLIGPIKTSVIRKIHALFAAQPEWDAFDHVTEIRAELGQFVVAAQR